MQLHALPPSAQSPAPPVSSLTHTHKSTVSTYWLSSPMVVGHAPEQPVNSCSPWRAQQGRLALVCQVECKRSCVSAWSLCLHQNYQTQLASKLAAAACLLVQQRTLSELHQECLPWLQTVVPVSGRNWKSLALQELPCAPRKEQGWCAHRLQSALPQTQPCVQSLVHNHHADTAQPWSMNDAHAFISCGHVVRR